MSFVQLLEQSDLGKAEREIKSEKALNRFQYLLNEDFPKKWLPFLYNFTSKRPWVFFDSEVILEMIQFLELDSERSANGIKAWENELSIVFNDFFNSSKVASSDYSLDSKSPRDNIVITNEVHPEYLWLCEHIFGNLVSLFWGINRKSSSPVKARFDLGNGERDLKKNKRDSFYNGFNDRVRNGIAHGEVHFRGDGIVYGKKDVPHEYKLDASQLLDTLDELRRTVNNLAIALVIFLGNNKKKLEDKYIFYLPSGLSNALFVAFSSREGFQIIGLVDSKFSLVGKQLQIYIKSIHRKRDILIYECLRIAKNLSDFITEEYDRYFYEIDTRDSISSSFGLNVKLFNQALLEDDIAYIPEVIDASLLWSDEGKWPARIKTYSYIFKQHFFQGINKFKKESNSDGPPYMVRSSEIISTEDDHRLKLKLLIDKSYNEDQIHCICQKVVRKYKYRPFFKKKDRLLKKPSSFRVPSYIWISAYYKDGPIRWLGKRGWLSGNIAFNAEWTSRDSNEPIYVKDHEIIKDNIRYQFKINEQAYEKVIKDVNDLIQNFQKKNN